MTAEAEGYFLEEVAEWFIDRGAGNYRVGPMNGDEDAAEMLRQIEQVIREFELD